MVSVARGSRASVVPIQMISAKAMSATTIQTQVRAMTANQCWRLS